MPTQKELAFAKECLVKCIGYLPKFIDNKTNISLDNILSQAMKKALPKVQQNNKGVLNYDNLSILYNAKRKVPFLSAYNIDGTDKPKQSPRPPFQPDPRIPLSVQLDKPFYDLRTDITEFEIGHMASNNEMGRGKNGIIKAFQTFHFTNSVPQAEKLNAGLWKGLESYVIREAATVKNNKRICVFTGPVLTNKDPGYVKDPKFKIPLLFFKVVVFLSPKGLFSTAFLMSHEKKLIEDNMFAKKPPIRRVRGLMEEVGFFTDFPYRKIFQVNIPFLEKQTGLHLSWSGVKQIVVPREIKLVEKIKGIKDAAGAKEAIRRGIAPIMRTTAADVTPVELATNNYLLDMILP